jgi:hypothetical protein
MSDGGQAFGYVSLPATRAAELGIEVGRAGTDAGGANFLPLPPGTYEIVPQAVKGLMGVAAETTVTVPDGAPVQLDLPYDAAAADRIASRRPVIRGRESTT